MFIQSHREKKPQLLYRLAEYGYSGFCAVNLANAISVQELGNCTAEARLPGGLPVDQQTGGQALRSRRRGRRK